MCFHAHCPYPNTRVTHFHDRNRPFETLFGVAKGDWEQAEGIGDKLTIVVATLSALSHVRHNRM
jgi:hypothetical protein